MPTDEQLVNASPFNGAGWGTIVRGIETMTETNRGEPEANEAEHGTQRLESDR